MHSHRRATQTRLLRLAHAVKCRRQRSPCRRQQLRREAQPPCALLHRAQALGSENLNRLKKQGGKLEKTKTWRKIFEFVPAKVCQLHSCAGHASSIRRFLTIVAGKIKKLAGGAAGAGRRRKRRWRSQTQAPKAQEATCEGKGEREEISLRQCVLRDHQIRSGMIGSGLLLHRRMWQRRRCSHSDNVGANLKNCSGIIKDEGGWHS